MLKNLMTLVHGSRVSQFLVLPIFLWALFSLPTILLSQWFPLDIPTIFNIGEGFEKKLLWIFSPYNGSGRYVPFYWVYHAIQYQLFGAQISWYFFAQSIVILAAILITALIFYRVTSNWIYTTILAAALYFSTPIAENINTIGKPEPIVFLFIVSACYLCLQREAKRINKLALIILFTLSMWTKETSIVLLGFSLTGLVLSFLLKKSFGTGRLIKNYVTISASLGTGFVVSRVPYLIFDNKIGGASYTSYEITKKLIIENISFYIEQQPDVMICGLLAFACLFYLGLQMLARVKYGRSSLSATKNNEDEVSTYIFMFSVVVMGAAYYLGLLIWRWPMQYYMVVPAMLFKLSAFYGIHAILNKEKLGCRRRTIFKYSVYVLFAIITLFSAFSIYYLTYSQIAYSRIYKDALEKYARLSVSGGELVIESYPFYSEQVGGTTDLLKRMGVVDSRIHGIADVLDPSVATPEILTLLSVSKHQLEENYRNLPKKGDYVLVFTGSKLASWFLRGVTPYFNLDSYLLGKQAFYEMRLVDSEQIDSFALFPHVWRNSVNFEMTSLGYRLYKVESDKPKFFWKNRFPDGWVSDYASLLVNNSYKKEILIKISSPHYNLPNKVIIKKDGEVVKEVVLTTPDEVSLNLGMPRPQGTLIEFEVEKTVSPKSLKINKDKRDLGVRAGLT